MADLTPLGEAQLAYWTGFNEFLAENSELFQQGIIKQLGPEAHMHQTFPFGYPWRQVAFECLANMKENSTSKGSPGKSSAIPGKSIAITLTMRTEFKGISPVELIASLERDKNEIERDVGSHLRWPDENTKGTRRVILLVKVGEDPTDGARRIHQYRWFMEKLEVFYRVFYPRVSSL